jgi:integrase/recombinase XerD
MDWVPVLRYENAPTHASSDLPAIIVHGGRAAEQAWDDFFSGVIANDLTRIAYNRAVRRFLESPRVSDKKLHEITAADVGIYLRELSGGLPKKKQHHSALRRFFNLMVERHLCIVNPALVARTERLEITEGKTPRITAAQSRRLLSCIDVETVVGLRDRAVVGILMWTGVRAGSVAKLCRGHYYEVADQWMLRFDEKRRRTREIPVRHDLQVFLRNYLVETELITAPKTSPLFLTFKGKTDRYTTNAMTGHDICRMFKRYIRRADLPDNLSPHSLRVSVATDLLEQNVTLADVQYLLGHADPRTTRLYDRRQKSVSRNLVERIRLGR